jgi:hypothetical protein
MIEALKKMYQLLLTEPHAPAVCDQLEVILRKAIAELESQEPVAQPASEEDMKIYRAIADNYRKELTHPPQEQQSCDKRTWVGLTDSQRKEIERQSVYVDGAIRMTEAKLKEKNT